MRTYPTNSPEAASRVLAMALLADGHFASVELNALDTLQATERLGISDTAFKEVVAGFAQDLLLATHTEWTGADRMDSATRQALLAEITDPYLQNDIQSLVHAVVMADGHLADGEAELVDTLWTCWQGQHIDIGSGS